MRKLTLLLAVSLLFSQFAMAASVTKEVRMQRGSMLVDVAVSTDGLTSETVEIDGKTYNKIVLDGAAVTLKKELLN